MKSNLYQRRWMPDAGGLASGQPRRSIYLLHGISEHTGRYDRLGQWLADNGWTVGAHDHHGFGQSPGERGQLRSQNAYVEDACDCLKEFAIETGTVPVLLGHSMGGVIATAAVLIGGASVSGLAVSSPAFTPALSALQRWRLNVMRVAPDFVLERSLDPTRLSHDPVVIAGYRDDELVHGFVSARLIKWILDTGKQCLQLAPQLSVPGLLLAGSADAVVDHAGFRDFAQSVPADLLTEHWYDGYLHEVFNEDQARRERVLDDLIGWLDSNFPAV